jgi:hypothetical protein
MPVEGAQLKRDTLACARIFGLRRAYLVSSFGDVDDRLGKSLRGFLREIVPDATANRAMLVSARELFRIGTGVRMRRAIGITF